MGNFCCQQTPNAVALVAKGSSAYEIEKTSPEEVEILPSEPVDRVGRYVLLRELGSGEQAVGFLAAKAREYEADASSCTLYACKVVKKRSLLRRHKKKCSTSAENRSNAPQGKYGYASGDIAREIAIIKKLDQENIVKVIEVLDNPDENRLYVIMDYLPGGSLFPDWDGDGTLDNPLEERDAVILFREIVMAVLYIHNQGVVHFDIKPSNILLAGKSVRKGVKLADFGVAHIFEDRPDPSAGENKTVENASTSTASCQKFNRNILQCGTPVFQSPELHAAFLRGEGVLPNDSSNDTGRARSFSNLISSRSLLEEGKAGDIWSLGVSLYLCLYGKPPFTGTTRIELSQSICSEKPSFPALPRGEALSNACKAFLERLLTKSMRNRPTIVELSKDPWLTQNGSLPALALTEKSSRQVQITKEEESKALTLLMKNFGFVAFSTKWMLHARKEVEKKKATDPAAASGSATADVVPDLSGKK